MLVTRQAGIRPTSADRQHSPGLDRAGLADVARDSVRAPLLRRHASDLDVSHPLPATVPWARQGVRWSACRTLLYIIGETAYHAGHPDILRQTIDGQKTMG